MSWRVGPPTGSDSVSFISVYTHALFVEYWPLDRYHPLWVVGKEYVFLSSLVDPS